MFIIDVILPLSSPPEKKFKLKNDKNYLFYLKNATLINISQILIKLQKRLTYFWKPNCPTKLLSTPLLSKINIKRFKRDEVNIFPLFIS